MHILFLTDNFPPEVNAPASRTFEHCCEWVKTGCNVTVITCAPNFPNGQLYAGYKNKLWQQETVNGIRVIRVGTYIAENHGFFKRVIDYLSFMLSGFLAGLFVRQVDVVVGTSPQFFTVCAAYMLGTIRRIPWVFELRDLWPESISTVGALKPNLLLKFLSCIELFLYKKAEIIIAVTHSFKSHLIQRGIDGTKIFVITNGVDSQIFSPQNKDQNLLFKFGLQNKFIAGYIGCITYVLFSFLIKLHKIFC